MKIFRTIGSITLTKKPINYFALSFSKPIPLTFLLVILLAMFSIPKTSAASSSPSATTSELLPAEQLFGDQIISTPTTWTNTHTILTGNLIVTHGGTLTLENTTLEMNVDWDYQYRIYVEANGVLIVNNSTITVTNKIYPEIPTKNTQIYLRANGSYPNENPTIQAENSTFEYLGSSTGGVHQFMGIFISKNSLNSYFHNSTFQYDVGGVNVNGTNPVEFIGNTFKNIGTDAAIGVAAIMLVTPINSKQHLIKDNLFDHIHAGNSGMDREPIYAHGVTNLLWDNNTIQNTSGWSGNAHQVNFYCCNDSVTFKNSRMEWFYDFAFNNPSNATSETNFTFENLTFVNSVAGMGTYQGTTCHYFTWKNINVITDSSNPQQGGQLLNVVRLDHSYFTDININGHWANYIIYTAGIYDSYFANWSLRGGTGRQNFQLIGSNNIFKNFSINATHGGSGGDNSSVWLTNGVNNSFIDWDIYSPSSGTYVGVGTGAFGNRWININDNGKVQVLSTGLYEKYAYLDVLVKDQSGNPLPGVTISITNVTNPNYPSINRNGIVTSVFTTDSTGHTPLPIVNDAATPVIMDYLQSSTGKQQMTYTIIASCGVDSAIVSGIQPDDTWYRINPMIPTETIVITLSDSCALTGMDEDENNQQLLREFALHQNYPNPFNPETNIIFDLPTNSFVSLKIFNFLGQEVAVLVSEQLPSGTHSYKVGSEQFGLASGVYFFRLSAGEFVQTRKMLMVR